MPLFRAIVTYLLRNVKYGIEHDIYSGWSFHALDIPEFYSTFDEYLAI